MGVLNTGRDIRILTQLKMGVGNKIRERLWSFNGTRMRRGRAEYNRMIGQMGKKINALAQNKKSLIAQEIDTGEEWGPWEDTRGGEEADAQQDPRNG